MNKKMWISIGVVAVLVLGIATAALTKSISNTVTAEIGVTSPIEVEWTELPPEEVHGGDTIEFETKATNLANRDVNIYNQLTTIETDEDWLGTEFDAIRVSGTDIPLSCIYHVKPDGTLIAFANIGAENTNKARLYMDVTASGGGLNCDGTPHTYTHSAGGEATSTVQADLNVAFATDDYIIKVCYLMDFTGDC